MGRKTAHCGSKQNGEKNKKAKKQGRNREIEERNQKPNLMFQRGVDGWAENDFSQNI